MARARVRRRVLRARPWYIAAWVASLVVHACAIGMILPLILEFHEVPQKMPFRWRVSIHESPGPQPVTSDVPSEALPAPAAARASSMPPPGSQEPEPLAQKDHPAPEVAERPADSRTPARTPRPQTIKPTRDPSAIRATSRTSQGGTPIRQARRVSKTFEFPGFNGSPFARSGEAALPPPAISSREADAQRVRLPSVKQHLPIAYRPEAVYRTVHRKPVRPDYGWLTESLSRKIQRLRRYPWRARMNGWEGRVLLQAVMYDDGSLRDIRVIESSGFQALDDNARDLLEHASPLELAHSLGRARIPLQVPITYRLE